MKPSPTRVATVYALTADSGKAKTASVDWFDGWMKGQTQKIYQRQITSLMGKWFGALARHGSPSESKDQMMTSSGGWAPFSPTPLRPVKGNQQNPERARYAPGIVTWASDASNPTKELVSWLLSKGWKLESGGRETVLYRAGKPFDWTYRIMVSPARGQRNGEGYVSATVAGLWPRWD